MYSFFTQKSTLSIDQRCFFKITNVDTIKNQYLPSPNPYHQQIQANEPAKI